VRSFTVLLALDEGLHRDCLRNRIASDMGPRVHVEYCKPTVEALEKAFKDRKQHERAPGAVIFQRDDNALPGICTHLFDQFPELGIVVISRNEDCPPLYYRQAMCVEELVNSDAAVLAVLRYLRK
jgi:hypothetical protein